jgi:uncharacterized protein (TIRG00374 family)
LTLTVKPKRVWKGRTIAIWTVLSAVIVFILLSLISDLEALENALVGFPLVLLVPVGLLSIGNYLLRYIKWHWYLKLLGHRINRFPNLLVFLSGFALTVTPGKVGEFVKAYIVKERFQVPYTASTAVLLMERFTDVAAIVLLSSLGLSLHFFHWSVAILPVIGLFAVLMLLRSRTIAGWVIDQTEHYRLLKRFSEPLRRFYEQGWVLLEMGIFVQSLVLSLAAWFLEGLGYAIVVWALGSPISLMEGVFIYSAALLGGALTLFLGGLGATEGGMVGLGMVFGMSASTATASTIIIRVMTLWFAVLIGWGVFLFTPGFRSLLNQARTDEAEFTSEEIEVTTEEML